MGQKLGSNKMLKGSLHKKTRFIGYKYTMKLSE
jgi:hypothetical protein